MSYYPPQQGYGGPPQGPPPQGYGQGYGQQSSYGGYGAPPPNQYPPQQGYSQNSSYPSQSGAYPPQDGAYPPQNQAYGQQPQSYPPQGYPPQGQAPYGAPPQNQYAQPYGAPQGQYPPPQGSPYPPQSGALQGQYPPPQGSPYAPQGGAPYGAPLQQFGPPNPPSLGYDPNVRAQVDMSADADALRKAMKGFGTDERTLIRILVRPDPVQALHLRNTFNQRFGRDLEKDIKSETSGWFETGLVALTRGPLGNDIHDLHEAMRGVGTNEDMLNDILLSRSNADMRAIKEAYRQRYHKDLDGEVKGELSLKTERHFEMVLAANRAEDSAPIIPQEIDRDVNDLYRATEGKVGTDELMVCSIMTSRNDNQLRAIDQAYEAKFGVKLEHVIKKEFRGHMETALLMQLKGAVNRPLRDAELLEAAMAGFGTKDRLLITRLVRFHWDRNYMGLVRQAYHLRFKRDLASESRVRGETSGHYESLCLALITGQA